MRRIVDLSMPVHADMHTFPRVPPPALLRIRDPRALRRADRRGGVRRRHRSPRSYVVVQDDHVGTHCDARKHIVPDAGGPETIPLEYCTRDGVLLDFTDREPGPRHQRRRDRGRARTIGYEVKERDIVLIHTGAGAYNTEERYQTDHPGMSAEATRWLIERGVRMMGMRRDHVRPAGVGDVREEAVLGGPPGDVGRGVLAPREPHEPRADRPPVRLHSSASCRSSGSARRPRRCAPSRSWRTERCCSSMTSAAPRSRRPAARARRWRA